MVEDEVPLAEMVRRGLVADGHSVEVVHDGVRGLEAAATGRHDVVVLDIMLPGLSGYRILERLRAAQVWTPVLMLTAKDGEHDEAEGLELGADDFLTKPFHMVVLLARIRALMRRPRNGAAPWPGPSTSWAWRCASSARTRCSCMAASA